MCSLEKCAGVFILTLTGDDGEHRLNPTLIDSIRAALTRPLRIFFRLFFGLNHKSNRQIFLQWRRSRLGKKPRSINHFLRPPPSNLIQVPISSPRPNSLPMPTIAAVTGHAAAAGFVLVLCHDYVLMRKDRGLLYMSELDIGLTVPARMGPLMKNKIGSGAARREVVMRAVKLTAGGAAEIGIVESVHGDAKETEDAAQDLGKELVGRRWDGLVYGRIRCALLPIC